MLIKVNALKVNALMEAGASGGQIFAAFLKKTKRYNALLDYTRPSNRITRNVNKRVCGQLNKRSSCDPRDEKRERRDKENKRL